jgi:hypothetical protein
MKKILLGLAILFLSSNHSQAKPLKIKIIEENKYGGIYAIKMGWSGPKPRQYYSAIKNTQNFALLNCKKYSKDAFIFFVDGFFNTVFDKTGMLKLQTTKSQNGFVPDFSRTMKITEDRFRFFCGKSINETIDVFIKRADIFSIKSFHTSLIWGEQGHLLKYVNLSEPKFNLQNVTQKMGNKIDLSRSALKECFGSTPNESWTACHDVSDTETHRYEGEYGGKGEKVSIHGKTMIPIKWHGYGKQYSKKNEWTYEGRFYDNTKSGFAKLTLKDGSVYEGQFKSGEIYGQGKWRYADGTTKEGFWNNGKTTK